MGTESLGEKLVQTFNCSSLKNSNYMGSSFDAVFLLCLVRVSHVYIPTSYMTACQLHMLAF